MYDFDRMNATRGYFYSDPERSAIESFAEKFGCLPPMHKIVCPHCSGTGARALHGIALSGDSLDDHEFMSDYMSGRYDTQCEDCKGQNVVDEIDEDSLTPAQRKLIDKERREARASNAESLAELRAGC